MSAFGKGTELSGPLCLWQCLVLKGFEGYKRTYEKRPSLKTFHLETNLRTWLVDNLLDQSWWKKAIAGARDIEYVIAEYKAWCTFRSQIKDQLESSILAPSLIALQQVVRPLFGAVSALFLSPGLKLLISFWIPPFRLVLSIVLNILSSDPFWRQEDSFKSQSNF